jgi:Flp pilus assembly protein TadD
MKRKALIKVAASSLILAATMVGCTGAAYRASPAFAGARAAGDASRLAATAEQALAHRNFAEAVTTAEAIVAQQPDSGAWRTLLGRAYLASGRFASAETAFHDAMTLGNTDSRTIVSLALLQIARGDSVAARNLLVNQMDHLPAADYGLAIAMAGDAPEGVRVLGEAIHDPSANARTRQNLAYAYALSGRWREARLIAEQDVAPTVAAQRVLKWAELAQPGAEPQRVAFLLGVDPRSDDSGLPVRLALAPATPAVVQVAAADAVVPQPLAPRPPVAIETAAADAPVVSPATVPMAVADARPVLDHIPIPAAPRLLAAARPAARPAETRPLMRKAAWITPIAGSASAWVVQLGAYDSAAIASEKWQRMARYNTTLGAFPVVNSTATVDGHVYYRLAVSGFGDRLGADGMCRALRADGGRCFVREAGPEIKNAVWASAKAKPRQFAMR